MTNKDAIFHILPKYTTSVRKRSSNVSIFANPSSAPPPAMGILGEKRFGDDTIVTYEKSYQSILCRDAGRCSFCRLYVLQTGTGSAQVGAAYLRGGRFACVRWAR